MDTLVIVGCGKKKEDERTKAKDMYISSYFQDKRKYAERNGDLWRILSAEHGLLFPEAAILPYDTTIDDLSEKELETWRHAIDHDLSKLIFDEIEIIAPQDYISEIEDILSQYEVRIPTGGMKMGETQQWLQENTENFKVIDGEEDSEDNNDNSALEW